MRREDILSWFESLEAKAQTPIGDGPTRTQFARNWTTQALSALCAVFPETHPVVSQWRVLDRQISVDLHEFYFVSFLGIFEGALAQIREGRIGSLIDAIRAETEGDLLDQADAFLAYPYAAAIVAGGALETHLRHLVNKKGLTINGEGSISKYDAAIAQARNAGNEIYSANLGKLVTGWGGIRNDAAHDPGNFPWSKEDVRRMIEGIRDFIERTS